MKPFALIQENYLDSGLKYGTFVLGRFDNLEEAESEMYKASRSNNTRLYVLQVAPIKGEYTIKYEPILERRIALV